MRKKLVIVLGVLAIVGLVLHGARQPYMMAGPAGAATVGININAVAIPATTASFTVNWLNGPYARVSASASPTAAYTLGDLNFTNPVDGNTYWFEWDQDATGEALTFPSVVAAPGGINAAPIIPSTANGKEIVQMIYNAASGEYIIQSITSNASQVNLHNNCATTLTLAAGVKSTTGAGACFTNYSRIGWDLGAGTPVATLVTPTATTQGLNARINCAQSAANSQTITCVSSDPQDTNSITVYGIN
jgi:hypothetical protein